jgi:phosphotransferase system enzyme I (PtsI)
MEYIRLRGIGVSPGVAQGEASLAERIVFSSRREGVPREGVKSELSRLKGALTRTREQIIKIRDEIKDKVGEEHSFIFEAHLMILDDKTLIGDITEIVGKEKVRAEWAITQVHEKYKKLFESIEDDYLRQRGSDVSDVLSKIYLNLDVQGAEQTDDGREKILVAHDLLPSEAAHSLSKGNVLAVVLDMGGQTSHTAILARSLNIPAVVGLSDATSRVKSGDYLIVDGTDGEVFINPAPAIRKEFISKKKKYDDYQRELRKTAKLKSITLDQVKFTPLANIELPTEMGQALSLGAEGIGLFRSEFIYLQSTLLPSEEDHFEIYRMLAKDSDNLPIYIRTMDVGGEKNLPQLKIEKEPNPALGLRAIRLSLREREIFKVQLRAILRASVFGNVKILIPMVTEIEELHEIKFLLEEVKAELTEKKIKFNPHIPLGVMIEVPAAAAITDLMVSEVDYFSIGTNDLIQYYLAVDRSNELVSYLYKPFHPSVLRLIRHIIRTAQRFGKDVTVCGEMAADPLSALVLLGFGLRKFSMNPIFIPRVKNTLRSVEYASVKRIVARAMKRRTAQEIEECLLENVLVRYPLAFLRGQASLKNDL